MKQFPAIVVVLILLLFGGCSKPGVVNVKTVGPLSEHLISIRGDIPSYKLARIDEALDALPEKIKNSVDIIQIRDDHEHFLDRGGDGKTIMAAHWENSTRTICIRSEFILKSTIWHESAHALTFVLGREFLREWTLVAVYAYGSDKPSKAAEACGDGMLTRYSRRNAIEDIAEWVGQCYCFLDGWSAALHRQYKYNDWIGKRDKRYREKLKLLKKWGFLTEENYLKLKPLFTP